MKIQIKRPQFDATLAQRLSGAARAGVMAADAQADAAYAALSAAAKALELAIEPGIEINSGTLLVAVDALEAWQECRRVVANLATRHKGAGVDGEKVWGICAPWINGNRSPESAIGAAIYGYTETLRKAGVDVPHFVNTGKVGDFRAHVLTLATRGA